MKNELYKQIITNLSDNDLNRIEGKTIHLGIFSEPHLSLMLSGKKTIESRFSKNKIEPYNSINKDDIVFIKESGGKLIGYFTINEVKFFDLAKTSSKTIKTKYNNQLLLDKTFWNTKEYSRYATLIFIEKICIIKPFNIVKRDIRSWIKL